MASNPEPKNAIRQYNADRTVMQAHPRRPKPTCLLEMQGRVVGILFEQCERFIGQFLDLLGERMVTGPESRRRLVDHKSVALPAL